MQFYFKVIYSRIFLAKEINVFLVEQHVLPSTGDIATQDCILGMEFSGRNPAGNRIMGLLAAKVCVSEV